MVLPQILASTDDDSCLKQLLLCCFKNGDFLFPSLHLHLLTGILLSPSDLIITMWTQAYLFLFEQNNPQPSLFIPLLKISQI